MEVQRERGVRGREGMQIQEITKQRRVGGSAGATMQTRT